MKVLLHKNANSVALEFQDIPDGQRAGIDDIASHLHSFSSHYVLCLDLMRDLSTSKDTEKLSALYAQIMKAMAFLDGAKINLELGQSAARNDISATDLGFPEIDDPFYKESE